MKFHDFKEIVSQCLNKDPQKRISIRNFLCSQKLSGMNTKNLNAHSIFFSCSRNRKNNQSLDRRKNNNKLILRIINNYS